MHALMHVPAIPREEHRLDDGTTIVLRAIRPDDAAELRRAFDSLSPESRYRRFFGAMETLNDETLSYLTNVDGRDHVAIVAAIESPDLKTETGVGVARFIRTPDDPEVAEAAVTVVDSMQKKGVGRLLLLSLARAARECGVRRFRATILASNEPMRRLAEEIGATVRVEDDATLAIEVSLDDAPGDRNSDSSLKRLLHEAASSMAVMIRTMRLPPT